jgi:glycosyltransferase involved in cell wall biosynthesis
MSDLKFCALGSLYDGENPDNLRQALDSIVSQTVPVPIFLVIDGPIRGELRDVVEEFNDRIFKILELPVNSGLGPALNFGLDNLKEKFNYVIRFDTDDINLQNRFEILIEAIRRDELDLVGSYVDEFTDDLDPKITTRSVPLNRDSILKNMYWRNPFNHPAVAFKVDAVIDVGGYDDVPLFEDWYLWAKMLTKHASVKNINNSLVMFRGGNAALSRRSGLFYAKKELYFFVKAAQLDLPFRWVIIFSLPIRLFLRLLPFRIFWFFYFFSRRIKS